MFGAISSSSAATFPVFHTSSYSRLAMALLFSVDIEETPYASPTALLYHSLLSSRLNLTVRRLHNDDAKAQRAWKEYIKHLTEALAAERRGDAVALFMKYVGMPADQFEAMRHAPAWPIFEAIAPTLAYDHAAILGEDASVPTERAAIVTAPTLVMNGGASYAFMYDTAQALGKAIPNAQVRTLEGQTHDVDPDVLAPVLMEFFSR